MSLKSISVFFLVAFSITGFSSEAWNTKSNFGGVGRHRGTGIAIGNRGYMGLGHYNGAGPNIMFDDWWEFDPATNTWSQKASYPFPTYAASSFTIGMKCYVGAGVSAGNLFYAFDPMSNTWTPIQPVPMGSTDQLAFSLNGKGYYINYSDVYEYDAALDQWTLQNPAPFSLSSWSSSFTIGEKAYVKTGNQLYEYKPATDDWTVRANFPGIASGGSAAFAVKGKGYIVCGYVGWLSELTDEVWEFDPSTNTWTQLDEFPGSSRRFSAGFSIGSKGYVGIGTTGTNMRDFWEFDELLSATSAPSQDVTLYPNPATDFINITGVTDAALNVYDVQGKLVLSTVLTGNDQVDIRSLEAGTYFIEILTGNSHSTTKFVFQP